MKTYLLITRSGKFYTINAPEWQQARRKARLICKDNSQQFSTVRLVREPSAPIFEQKPVAAAQKVRELSKYVGQIVTFTNYSASGKWLGNFWGTLTSVDPTDKTPVIQTSTGVFSPSPKHVVTTGKRPNTHEQNSLISKASAV